MGLRLVNLSVSLTYSERDVQRFWAKTDRRGEDECWPWLGGTDRDGYGFLKISRKDQGVSRNVRASRVSWEIANGASMPTDLWALHHCDNPPCVNPCHIYPGSAQNNAADRIVRKRDPRANQTQCLRGHAFTAENTIFRANGTRQCRACRNQRRSKGLGPGYRSDLHGAK